ncbi:ABC transporter ATP-binding protein [bacterium]|nr:ABC transporter ATP-binding protein [bacterium]
MSAPLAVRLHDVTKSFPGTDETVLSIATLELKSSQQMALRGRSGSGKSTLLNLIAGILVADHGLIEVAGRDMARLSEPQRDQWRGQKIGFVHQSFHLLSGLTVWENLWVACALSGSRNHHRIENLITRMDLQKRRDHRPAQLSLGQQQRVAVARALVHQPALVLADEPTGNLDSELAQTALQLLRSVCEENAAALLLVSHDPAILSDFEHRLDLTEINKPC